MSLDTLASLARRPPTAAPVSRDEIVGGNQLVPLADGRMVPYTNLDNAASTPALTCVAEAVDDLLPFYSGVHRGTGYKSRVSTAAFEHARQVVAEFVRADLDHDVVVFTKNTTESINRMARSIAMRPDAIVVTTGLEHHSNDLPWRARAETLHARITPSGMVDLDHLDQLLRQHAGRVALLAVCGASNVTGVVQPVHRLARMVHAAGGLILVDAAQLAAHHPIDMRRHDDPAHLDMLAFSAHKMYAPFGSGVLVAPRSAFAATPDHAGGGTVNAVTLQRTYWADLPEREEAGSPNVLGAVALAAAIRRLTEVGLDSIARHEAELTSQTLERLRDIGGIDVVGPVNVDRVGVVSFEVEGLQHGLAAAALGYEHGIGVRSGCFCAHPYIGHLLGFGPAGAMAWAERAGGGDKRGMPGFVRMSLGCYNDRNDIDRLAEALERIVAGDLACEYDVERDGSFHPRGYIEPLPLSLSVHR